MEALNVKFVFDLDGTICFKGEPVSDKILNSLKILRIVVIKLFLHLRDRLEYASVINKDFHDYTMIGGNGSLILSKGKIIKSVSFSLSEMEKN